MTHHVQVRLESEEYKEFKKKADAAGYDSLQAAILHCIRCAIEEWGEPQPGKVPPKLRHYARKLEVLLASGNDKIIDAVTSNVDVFSELCDLQRGTSKAGGDNASKR